MYSTDKVIKLRTEYTENPIGIEAYKPRLSWEVEVKRRNWFQTAYQILVAHSEESLSKDIGDLWDSGKITSKQSINIEYKGKDLKSAQRYFWKVRVWNDKNEPSEYSENSYWEMGLLKKEDWIGGWIGTSYEKINSMPIFRKEFKLEKNIKSARLYVSGLGHYEVYLNGEKVGNSVLDPGWTNYKKSCLYSIYDTTEMIDSGDNVIGIMLGNGMFNVTGGRYVKFKGSFGNIKFILQIKVEYEDGSTEFIVSDESWKVSSGPITFSCIYGGEDYDAGKEQEGWNNINFQENESWSCVSAVDSPGGILKSQINPPTKVMKIFNPKSICEPKPGVFVYDLGQNFSGWVKIAVQGKKNAEVKITPAELLTEEGMAYQRFTGGPHYYVYTLKGEVTEIWNPRFSYYGFRYVQVEGAVPQENSTEGVSNYSTILKELKGQMIYPDVETVGQFECSNTLFNKIHEIINWAILSNMKSVFTDCPHREKLGWLEQIHLIGPSIMYNYGVHNLYSKVMDDITEAQLDNGLVPDIAPEYVLFGYHDGFRDSPEWGSASVIAPWYMYKKYGDTEILSRQYNVMCKYVEYLKSRTDRHILRHGLGDWLDVGPTPPYSHNTPVPVTATAIYYYDIMIMEKAALLLGKEEDARKYAELGKAVKESFNREFFDDQALRYVTGSQASNAMPLFLDMVEKQYEAKVLENLIKDIRARGNHTTAGDVGHPFVLMALTKYNRSDVIADMLKIKDSPSYGFQVEKGATTLCEDWDGPDPEKPRGSQNHLMLGSAEEWFYAGLAGIRTLREDTNLEEITIRPHIDKDIEWVKAWHRHPYGQIKVEWKKLKEDKLKIDISIPTNAKGNIYIPCKDRSTITEGSKLLEEVKDVELVHIKEEFVVLKVGSGNYSFIV